MLPTSARKPVTFWTRRSSVRRQDESIFRAAFSVAPADSSTVTA